MSDPKSKGVMGRLFGGKSEAAPSEEEVVDAEFSEVDDENKG